MLEAASQHTACQCLDQLPAPSPYVRQFIPHLASPLHVTLISMHEASPAGGVRMAVDAITQTARTMPRGRPVCGAFSPLCVSTGVAAGAAPPVLRRPPPPPPRPLPGPPPRQERDRIFKAQPPDPDIAPVGTVRQVDTAAEFQAAVAAGAQDIEVHSHLDLTNLTHTQNHVFRSCLDSDGLSEAAASPASVRRLDSHLAYVNRTRSIRVRPQPLHRHGRMHAAVSAGVFAPWWQKAHVR